MVLKRLSRANRVGQYARMIIKTLPFILALGAGLLAGCAGPRYSTDNYRPPFMTASPANALWIISATYGSGSKFADVTDRVNDLIHQPDVEFFARPEWLHADPNPNWNKDLVIVYEYKGRRHIFTTGEGGRVTADELIRQKK